MATLSVLSPGLYTLVVDAGRPRSRSLGVPVGGAADRFAFAVGNALVGNDPDAAALEVTLAGPTLMADEPLACVVYGAAFDLWTDRRDLRAGWTFTLEAGEVLHVGGARSGARAYLCVAGGIDAPLVLGSRSALGPLKQGETLACQTGRMRGRSAPSLRIADSRSQIEKTATAAAPPLPVFRSAIRNPQSAIRVLPGGQSALFPDGALCDSVYRITPASNRMGTRLAGPPLPVPSHEMTSEPVCPGTLQVTRDGQCIVLGVDGQTIGGYPKAAQVVAADLDRLAQLRPGDEVRFVSVTPDEAARAWRERNDLLRQWLTRLRTEQTAFS